MLVDPIRGAGSNWSCPIKNRVPPDIRSSRWLGPPPLPEELGHWRQAEMVVSKLQLPRPSDSGSPKLGLCEFAAPVKRGSAPGAEAVTSGPRSACESQGCGLGPPGGALHGPQQTAAQVPFHLL